MSMEQPAKDEMPAVEESAHWSRHAARLSAASAFVCFTLNCVVNNLLLRNPEQPRNALRLIVDCLAGLIILVGLVSGIAGLSGGIRKKSSDTIGIAIIGLVLNSGIVFVILWGLWVLRSAKGP
ncbi:MAG: hypothetical protein K8R36_02910 [Planctomycetales bacterium]|nr:hypothetical protein [Planctomycetales bacterium]